MSGESERLARTRLVRVLEPGEAGVCGSVHELGGTRFLATLLADDRDATARDRAARLAACDPERELERAAALGIRFVIPTDEEWPQSLDALAHADVLHQRGGVPVGLWVAGPLRLDGLGRQLAVVGSRSATTYGEQVASSIAAGCARAGITVTSGAAFGIDQAAHRGSLAAGGNTVAVLACGVDRAYPSAHRPLLEHLARTSAVISEAAPGCSPIRVRFLARNRIIAALASGTVVVEAAVRSGALNTASWAGELNRPVMAVPGPVTSAPSGGVHQLIRDGGAVLVTNSEEVLEVVGAVGDHLLEVPRAETRPRDRLSWQHRQVLDAVPVSRPAHSDSIAAVADLGVLPTRRALERLQAIGMVQEAGQGWTITARARG